METSTGSYKDVSCKRCLNLDFDKLQNFKTLEAKDRRESLDVAYQAIQDLQDKDFTEFWKGLTPQSSRRKDGPTMDLDQGIRK